MRPSSNTDNALEELTSGQIIAGIWLIYWLVAFAFWSSNLTTIEPLSKLVCQITPCITLYMIGFSVVKSELHYRIVIVACLIILSLSRVVLHTYCAISGEILSPMWPAFLYFLVSFALLRLFPRKEILSQIARLRPKNNMVSSESTHGSDRYDLSDFEPVDGSRWQFKPAKGDHLIDRARVEIYKSGRKKGEGWLFVTRKGLTCRPIDVQPKGGRAFWKWREPCPPVIEVESNEVKFVVALEGGGRLHLYVSRPNQRFRELCQKVDKHNTPAAPASYSQQTTQ